MIKIGDLIRQRKEISLPTGNIGADFYGRIIEIKKVINKSLDIEKFKNEGIISYIDLPLYEIYYDPVLDNISDEQLDYLIEAKKILGQVKFFTISLDLQNLMSGELL